MGKQRYLGENSVFRGPRKEKDFLVEYAYYNIHQYIIHPWSSSVSLPADSQTHNGEMSPPYLALCRPLMYGLDSVCSLSFSP